MADNSSSSSSSSSSSTSSGQAESPLAMREFIESEIKNTLTAGQEYTLGDHRHRRAGLTEQISAHRYFKKQEARQPGGGRPTVAMADLSGNF